MPEFGWVPDFSEWQQPESMPAPPPQQMPVGIAPATTRSRRQESSGAATSRRRARQKRGEPDAFDPQRSVSDGSRAGLRQKPHRLTKSLVQAIKQPRAKGFQLGELNSI